MLRFHPALCLGLACAFVLPAWNARKLQSEPLETTLARTRVALERLNGIEQRLRQRDAGAIADAIAATEAPLPSPAGDPAARDAQLDALRREVVALQGELEGDAPLDQASTQTAHGFAPATQGLDETQLRALAPFNDPGASATEHAHSKQAFENAGYTADALRLGHAYYQGGKLEQALVMFENTPPSAEASYWRARSLERLGRTSEALDAYARVVAMPGAGSHAARASEDLEFLRWRVALENRLAQQRPAARKEQP